MKASRLKTLVIVILLLVNAFLLFLLLSRRAEQTQAYERTVEQLCELFARSGVSFDRALLPENSDVYALSPERSSTREMAFAKSLLGDDVSAFDSGGGISRYSSSLGSCSLRSGGTVDAASSAATFTALCLADPLAWLAADLVVLDPVIRNILRLDYRYLYRK